MEGQELLNAISTLSASLDPIMRASKVNDTANVDIVVAKIIELVKKVK
jgi:hypothetical protein